MSNLNKLLALVLALIMACALTFGAVAETAEATEERTEGTLVYATSTFGQKFSPFFATTAYDMEVVDLTQIGLLAADRGGHQRQRQRREGEGQRHVQRARRPGASPRPE